MGKEVKNMPIRCQVVAVDEKTTRCQKVGNAFLVDETIKGKLCPRAQALVQAAADRMDADATAACGSPSRSVDVPCPDHHVIYRLSFLAACVMALLLSLNESRAGAEGDGFVEHFDSFPSQSIWSANAQDLSRINIVTNPVRYGAGAIKLTVLPGDIAAKKNRAEINIVYGDKPGTENWRDAWYAWSVMVPLDYYDDQRNPRFQIMGQFHVVPEFQKGEAWEDYPGVPPMLCIRYGYDEGGAGFGLFYGLDAGNQPVPMIAKKYIKKGEWNDITLHMYWSASKEGFVEAWLNDEPLTPWNGKDHKFYGANMYNAAAPMLKLGLYRDWGFKTANSVYYDELRIGHSREEVRVPIASRPSPSPP